MADNTIILNENGNGNGTQDSPFRINAIRPALVKAHNANNRKAIDEKICKGLGIAEDTMKAWEARVEHFRIFTVQPFVQTFFNEVYENEKAEERKKLEDAIFPEWKDLLRSGEKDLIHKELRPDPYDLYLIFKFGTTHVESSVGSQFAIAGKKVFRKGMETVLGLKMAQNEVLTDNDRDILINYEFHDARSEKKRTFLDGDGKDKKGAYAEKEALTAKLNGLVAKVNTITSLIEKTPKDQQDSDLFRYLVDSVEAYDKVIADTKQLKSDIAKEIGNAEALMKESDKYVANNKDAYDAIKAKLNVLE